LNYNCFTHELQTPEVHLFFLKMNVLAPYRNAQT
jgi:hypothetical protein